jgi:hypothetical protein
MVQEKNTNVVRKRTTMLSKKCCQRITMLSKKCCQRITMLSKNHNVVKESQRCRQGKDLPGPHQSTARVFVSAVVLLARHQTVQMRQKIVVRLVASQLALQRVLFAVPFRGCGGGGGGGRRRRRRRRRRHARRGGGRFREGLRRRTVAVCRWCGIRVNGK